MSLLVIQDASSQNVCSASYNPQKGKTSIHFFCSETFLFRSYIIQESWLWLRRYQRTSLTTTILFPFLIWKIFPSQLLSWVVSELLYKKGLQAKIHFGREDYMFVLNLHAEQVHCFCMQMFWFRLLTIRYASRICYGDWGRELKHCPQSSLVLSLDPGQLLHMLEFLSHPSDMLALQSIRPRTEQKPDNCPDHSCLVANWQFPLEQ